MINRRTTAALVSCLAFTAGSAMGATITQDFEGQPTDGSAPAGFSLVTVSGAGTYSTTAGTGTPGQSGNFTDDNLYIVSSGAGLDTRQAFSGSFDFYIVEDGNYSHINFYIGDVGAGLGGAAGDNLNVILREKTFGSRAAIVDGAGGSLVGGSSNDQEVATNEWNAATFTWTPDSPGLSTAGVFTINWDGPGYGGTETMSTAFTFDELFANFGFGTNRSPARFDNINITGTVVPEPGSLALLGLGGLLSVRQRRRA